MIGWLARFGATPLLWACGLLLAAAVVQTGRIHLLKADVSVANAASASAVAWANELQTSRDAWKGAAERMQAATTKWESAFATVHRLLQDAQRENARIDAANRAAVSAAQAREAEANRTLDAWMQRYAAQVRQDNCAAALSAVQAACPALEGY